MRKIFAILILGVLFLPSAEAFVYRQQPSYSFRTSLKKTPQRFVRAPWVSKGSRYNFRYVTTFQRTDYERWRSLSLPKTKTEEDEPKEQSFCNFIGTIIGEYLPVTEVTNRCCVCFDGWKCEIPDTANLTRKHECDPGWAANQGFIDTVD